MGITQRRTDKELIQARALKTREKLLVSALELYTVKGYNRTTVDEVAEHAGLSTGTAYRYFRNKKDLLLETLSFSFENIGEIAGVSETDLWDDGISGVLTAFERIHTEYRDLHEELESLRHSDEDVRALYLGVFERALSDLYEQLPLEIKKKPYPRVKLHIMIGLMENYCHTYMEGTLSEGELQVMRDEVIRLIQKELWEI